MDTKYAALIKNHACHLFPPQKGINAIDKIERKQDDNLDRYKARLVVKGFKQRYDINYEDSKTSLVW
jgi:putative heme iron utilization protein